MGYIVRKDERRLHAFFPGLPRFLFILVLVVVFCILRVQDKGQPIQEEFFLVAGAVNDFSPSLTNTSIWPESEIVSYMQSNPSRAYFSRLFRDGGFRSGIEVGTADGRYSEHFLKDLTPLQKWSWTIVEPLPNTNFQKRITTDWKAAGLLEKVNLVFKKHFSLEKTLLDSFPDGHSDFIYLDGDHSYEGVKAEIPLFWEKIKSGGILAGHDYCNHGEQALSCNGCENIPQCQKYTEYGVANGKNAKKIAANQNGVVMAVQEWLTEVDDPRLLLHHTIESFTKESLRADGMDYDLIITNTRNPSWFIVKP